MASRLSTTRSLALICCFLATQGIAQNKPIALPSDSWTNPARARIEFNTRREFQISIVNRGTIKVTDSTIRFLAPYTELGAYLSDPSTNFFTDLTVGASGYLTGGVGDLFIVSGNFTNNSSQNMLWNTNTAELDFADGTGPHTFALAGADQGASYFGYINNFAWGIFRLRSGQSLTLSDGNGTGGAALYATRVVLDSGTSAVANIIGNGFAIYYDPTDSGNNYLLVGAPGGIYALSGGGVLAPVAAALKINSVARLANSHIVLQCLGVPDRNNRIEASPDLSAGSFITIGTVAVGATGTFQFEDSNAGTKRFYRIAFP